MTVVVTLRPDEMALAVIGGGFRHIRAVNKGFPDTFEGPYKHSFGPHVDGALAEMAVARHYGFYWSPTCVTNFKGLDGDAGPLQVRSTTQDPPRLIVRPRDRDNRPYVLVLSRAPHFELCGWLTGAEAKVIEWARNQGEYFSVPVSALHPMESLAA